MRTSRKVSEAVCGAIFRVGLILVCLLCTSQAFAGGPKGDPTVKEMMEGLSRRVDSLERENRLLRGEVSALKGQLQSTSPAISAMQQMSETMPKTEQRMADMEKQLAATDQKVSGLETTRMPFDIGFRTGWSDVPFDLPGGFYFDAHLGHNLLTQEDGIPFGDIGGEIAIGLAEGNQLPMTVTTLAGTPLKHPENAKVSLSMVFIDPTVQYTLKHFEPFEPYVLAGPELAIMLGESRPLNAGQLPLPPELRQRGLPTIGTAHVFAGGVFGFGWQYRLSELASALDMPGLVLVLGKVSVGPEWRYHVMENGENFQTYSGSITVGF